MDFLTDSDILRFWSKVDVKGPEDCWPWRAKSRLHFGYGVLKVREHGNIVSSRISCFLHHGPAPHQRAKCLHSCDNPSCCNPKHLRWGTQSDNVKDAIERKRHINPPSVWDNPKWAEKTIKSMSRGEGHNHARHSDADVIKVHELRATGMGPRPIAKTLELPEMFVQDVIYGRTRRYLHPDPEIRGRLQERANPKRPRKKYTDDQVEEIRSRRASGQKGSQISAEMGVPITFVHDVMGGRTRR